MVEAGKGNEPFTIHLPNKLSPHFSVIDNGIGLSDEQIRSLYSTYFQSTKTNTNEQIGAFGLGSKSPFSYSKAFDVISRFNGEKRTYTVFVNEDGVPTISEMANVSTKEGNGIEVKIAVREQDYHTFSYSAAKVLQYFPVRPTIMGDTSFSFPEISKSATVTDSYIVDKESNGMTAVQGNVPYKVDTHHLSSIVSSATMSFVHDHKIVLFFDIGQLDIAASREEVRYDDNTVQNMADALQVAFDDYIKQLDLQMTALTKSGSVWDLYKLLHDKFDSKTALQRLVGNDFKFKSKIANQWMTSDKLEYDMDWKYHKIIPYGNGDTRAVRKSHDHDGYGDDRTYHIRPSEDTQVVIQDVTKRGSLRMNTKLTSSWSVGVHTLMAIIPATDRALTKAGVTATAAQRAAELKVIIKQFGNPDVKKISEWTADVTVTRTARVGGHTFKQFCPPAPNGGRKRRVSKPCFEVVSMPSDGGLYIEIDHLRNVIIDGSPMHQKDYSLRDELTPVLNVINLSRGTNYRPRDVYGITKKVVKSVADDADWIHVVDAYKEAIVDQKDIIEYYSRISNSTGLDMNNAITESSFINMIGQLDTNSTFRSILEPVIEKSKAANELANHDEFPVNRNDFRGILLSFEQRYGIDHKVSTKAYYSSKDLAPYPMLKHINLSYSHYCNDAAKYIELVEAA